jgi:NAD+ diphosphatase
MVSICQFWHYNDSMKPARQGHRHILSKFVPEVQLRGQVSAPAWWFAFAGNRLLVLEDDDRAGLPCLIDPDTVEMYAARKHYLGVLAGRDCFAIELETRAVVPEGMALHGLRGLFGRLDDDLFSIAGRAIQVLDWDRNHQFCGRCGEMTEQQPHERARRCPSCGLTNYPRLSPAVIVLVRKGDEVLLARAHNFPGAFYSTLAGFVEPGETLEDTVQREIFEEVGIEVTNIRYFGSQPWPFPNSLMIGFLADYAAGEITIDNVEIKDAGWFHRDNMPRIPAPISISRALIDSYLNE